MIGAAAVSNPTFSTGEFDIQIGAQMEFYEGQVWRVEKGHSFDVRFENAKAIQPVFANPLPFGGQPVIEIVSTLANLVDGIIKRFQPHFWDSENGIPLSPEASSVGT